jgi:hypothetical protein
MAVFEASPVLDIVQHVAPVTFLIVVAHVFDTLEDCESQIDPEDRKIVLEQAASAKPN